MLGGVRQGLLGDAVDRALDLWSKSGHLSVHGDIGLYREPVHGARPAGERLERRHQPKVIQRRRAERGDQVTERLDFAVHMTDGRVDRAPQVLYVLLVPCPRQQQSQGAQILHCLVMKLAGPTSTLELARAHAVEQALALSGALCEHPLGNGASEIARCRGVVAPEWGRLGAQRDRNPRLLVEGQRLDQDRNRIEAELAQPWSLAGAGSLQRQARAILVQVAERGARERQAANACMGVTGLGDHL